MTIALIVIAGLLGVGMLLVVFGTVAKNGWGINLNPIFCPNCNAQIPQVRHPQNVRQTLWGGSYCPQCGAEVDKWGRLLQAPSPKRALSAREPFVPMSRRRLLLLASVPFFCMALLWNWFEVNHSLEPHEGVITVVLALFDTAVFTVLFWFTIKYLLGRWFPSTQLDKE